MLILRIFMKMVKILEEGDYKDGKRDGLFKQYYKDGFLEREGLYKNGIRVGKWNEWSVVVYGLDYRTHYS